MRCTSRELLKLFYLLSIGWIFIGFFLYKAKKTSLNQLMILNLASEVVSVMDTDSTAEHENLVVKIAFSCSDNQVKAVSLTRVSLKGLLPGKYGFNYFIKHGLDLLQRQATPAQSKSSFDDFFSFRCNKWRANE